MSQRRWGTTRCRKFLSRNHIIETKQIGTLTDRQRRILAAALQAAAEGPPSGLVHDAVAGTWRSPRPSVTTRRPGQFRSPGTSGPAGSDVPGRPTPPDLRLRPPATARGAWTQMCMPSGTGLAPARKKNQNTNATRVRPALTTSTASSTTCPGSLIPRAMQLPR